MRPFLFIHIPKTAGTSIWRAFNMQPRFRNDQVAKDVEAGYDPEKDVSFGHNDINQVVKRGVLPKDDWHNYYKFCFVRNPWDRIVSLYEYLKREDETFENFVFNLENYEEIGYFNVRGRSQARPQCDWIPRDIDYIGKVETIDSDIERICQITERELPKVKRQNVTPNRGSRHYKEYFEEKSTKLILKDQVEYFYKKDFKRFGYTY